MSLPPSDANHLSGPQRLWLFRDIFLSHGLQLGCCISDTRAAALRFGESSTSAVVTSSAAVPPVLIHIAQLWGSLLWQETNHKFGLAEEDDQLAKVQVLLDIAPNDVCDPVTTVLAHCLVSMYHFSKVNIVDGREHLARAALVVSENHLRLCLDSSSIFSSNSLYSSQEINAILLQLLYQDTAGTMLLNLPALVGVDLYAQFQNLPVPPRDSSKLDLIVFRTKSVFHLNEANHLANVWHGTTGAEGQASFPVQSYEWYFDLVQRISNHIAILTPILLQHVVIGGDPEPLRATKLCLAMEHAAAAELYELLAATEPLYCGKSLTSALEVVQITSTFDDSDFHFLDPILGVCWTTATTVLRRIQGMIKLGSAVPLQLDEWTIRRGLSTMISASVKLERAMPFVVRPPELSTAQT
ncbi:hypothetical protein OE88DRAFT_1738612 [Heliocybe sulcata]|uniref:Transcription factor domain-containing protein n=1 Tax=Heliocybe sulcata TaxID=5364 RepID=A0A5C3MSB4_9AGAM|nr:hypothetical protein OE88DRAFT_1738612 [Heliocybe sulcata]